MHPSNRKFALEALNLLLQSCFHHPGLKEVLCAHFLQKTNFRYIILWTCRFPLNFDVTTTSSACVRLIDLRLKPPAGRAESGARGDREGGRSKDAAEGRQVPADARGTRGAALSARDPLEGLPPRGRPLPHEGCLSHGEVLQP